VCSGFEKPSNIQSRAIPAILNGLLPFIHLFIHSFALVLALGCIDGDVIMQAQSGTGKTAAYLIPLIMKTMAKVFPPPPPSVSSASPSSLPSISSSINKNWSNNNNGNKDRLPFALILVPTNELAKQIHRVCAALCDFLPLRISLPITTEQSYRDSFHGLAVSEAKSHLYSRRGKSQGQYRKGHETKTRSSTNGAVNNESMDWLPSDAQLLASGHTLEEADCWLRHAHVMWNNEVNKECSDNNDDGDWYTSSQHRWLPLSRSSLWRAHDQSNRSYQGTTECHILIGTPRDIYLTAAPLSQVNMVVLDECDILTNDIEWQDGQRLWLKSVMQRIKNKDAQVIMTSTTITDRCLQLSTQFMRNPTRILLVHIPISLHCIPPHHR
jgi:superfamily II DNA/RNA helicase